jgi:hypothetical protein
MLNSQLKAFLMSGLSIFATFLYKASPALCGWVLKPKFQVPNLLCITKEIATRGQIPFAYSEVVHKKRIYFAVRNIDRSEMAKRNLIENSISFGSYDLTKTVNMLQEIVDGGEDPRLFIHNDEAYLYFQKRSGGNETDCDIFTLQIETGVTSEINSLTGFNGKNWIPLSHNGKLHLIYGLSPLSVISLENAESGFRVYSQSGLDEYQNAQWGDGLGIFSSIRGGSPFEKIDSEHAIAFTHITPWGYLKNFHRVGLLVLNIPTGTLSHSHLQSKTYSLALFDPYGISIKNSVNSAESIVGLWTSSLLGELHDQRSVLCTNYIEFRASELLAYSEKYAVPIGKIAL